MQIAHIIVCDKILLEVLQRNVLKQKVDDWPFTIYIRLPRSQRQKFIWISDYPFFMHNCGKNFSSLQKLFNLTWTRGAFSDPPEKDLLFKWSLWENKISYRRFATIQRKLRMYSFSTWLWIFCSLSGLPLAIKKKSPKITDFYFQIWLEPTGSSWWLSLLCEAVMGA